MHGCDFEAIKPALRWNVLRTYVMVNGSISRQVKTPRHSRVLIRVWRFRYSSGVPLYRVQIELNMDTGNELDKSINTWHAVADNPTELESGFVVALTTFYGSIDGQYSSAVDPAASWYRAYDLADPEPRAPVLEENFTLGTTGTDRLPAECAIVLSFEAPQSSGQPQARRRGRVYLGPLSNGVCDPATGLIRTTSMDEVRDAAQILLDTSQAATTWSWQVYSRRNEASIEVMHAWIDNAFDIQRRRGVSATIVRDMV